VGWRHATNRSRVNRPQRSKELRSPRSAQWERPLSRNSCDTDSGTNPGERKPARPLPHPQNRSSHKTKTEETRQIRLRLSARSCSNDSAHNDRDSRGTLTQHDPALHHLHDPHQTAPRQGHPETLAQATAPVARSGTIRPVDDLGFLSAYAVVRILGYDLDAVDQSDAVIDPRYRSECLKVFWTEDDAQAEAHRLNEIFAARPIHHLVQRTNVQLRPGDPQFDGLCRGSVYIVRADEEEVASGKRRYHCHWEVEGATFVYTDGFERIDDALRWARKRAPSITVRIDDEHYSAGESERYDDLPRWPPRDWQDE
jgi:hypothetical protein